MMKNVTDIEVTSGSVSGRGRRRTRATETRPRTSPAVTVAVMAHKFKTKPGVTPHPEALAVAKASLKPGQMVIVVSSDLVMVVNAGAATPIYQ